MGLTADRAGAQVLALLVTARRRDLDPRGEGVLPIEEVDLPLVGARPHGDVDGNRALGGDQISAVLGKFGIGLGGAERFGNAVRAEEGRANAV